MKQEFDQYLNDYKIHGEALNRMQIVESNIRGEISSRMSKLKNIDEISVTSSKEFNKLLGNSIKYISKRYKLSQTKYGSQLVYCRNGICVSRRSYELINFFKTKLSYDDHGIHFSKIAMRYSTSDYTDFSLPWKLFQPDMVGKIKDCVDKIIVVSDSLKKDGGEDLREIYKGNISNTFMSFNRGFSVYQQIPSESRSIDVSRQYSIMSDIVYLIQKNTELAAQVFDDMINGLDKCFEYAENRNKQYKDLHQTICNYNAPFNMLKQIKES